MKREVWKNIFGFTSYYQVSNTGKVRGLERIVLFRFHNKKPIYKRIKSTLLKPANCKGYLFVAMSRNDIQFQVQVHTLVGKHFVPNPKRRKQINHKDFDKHNNNASNLEWVTDQQNKNHFYVVHKRTRGKRKSYGK